MQTLRSLGLAGIAFAIIAGSACAQGDDALVVSSDAELGALAARLLPDLADRAGLSLVRPVRLEKRSRAELVGYLEAKLEEELPAGEAEARVDAYALLGLVDPDLDLRSLLLDLYTEQVAGFYEPDSTALFVMDDQPAASLEALLLHELVHAIQDQSVDLDALTDPERGNDRATAAHAAIEGHATLVMLEYMYEQMTGGAVDLGSIPDFASQLRPALEAMNGQFPALSGAPRVIREGLLFPYLEGAGYVQRLWASGERAAPFGAYLPESTEQLLDVTATDPPLDVAASVTGGGEVVLDDVLGRLELGIFLEDVLGVDPALADAWEGDRYLLVDTDSGVRGLVSIVVWEGASERDRYVAAVNASRPDFAEEASVRSFDAGDRPASELRIGLPDAVRLDVELPGSAP